MNYSLINILNQNRYVFGLNIKKLININVNKLNINKQQIFKLTTNTANEIDKFDEDSKDTDKSKIPATNIIDYEEKLENEAKYKELIEKKRDVSRLQTRRAREKCLYKMPVIYDEDHAYLKNVKYYRKLYSRNGKASGIEAGLCWPTKSQLAELINDEKVYDLTLKQKIEILAERKFKEINEFRERYNQTDDALKKMPKSIEDFYQRVYKKSKADEDRLKRKNEILEKAREYYGYDVDIRDTRIQTMIQKLEDEKKLQEKKAKLEARKKKQNV